MDEAGPGISSLPKLLIVEDESIIALDLKETLSRCDYEVIAIATSAREALDLAGRLCPHLVLMDVHLSGSIDGIDAAGMIREQYSLPIVYLTAHTDSKTLSRATDSAPFGFVTKPWNVAQLDTTIRIALQQNNRFRTIGEAPAASFKQLNPRRAYQLTPRQLKVIELIATGKANKEIAADLNVSVKTVNFHKANLMDRLGLRTTAELTRFAVRHGLVLP